MIDPQQVKLGAIPDEAEIVFLEHGCFWVMDAEGGHVTQITFEPQPWEHVGVSHDRRYIAGNRLTHGQVPGKGHSTLRLYDLREGTEIDPWPEAHNAGSGGVDFTPDGRLYFCCSPAQADPSNVWSQRPGEAPVQVTHILRDLVSRPPDPALMGDVSVSQDGTVIGVARHVCRKEGKIWESEQPQTVLDGWIVHGEVWMAQSDGKNFRQVYDGGDELGKHGNNVIGSFDPDFSPDNERLVFSKTNTGFRNFNDTAHDIYTINADGSGLTRLTEPGPVSIIADWRGEQILYTELNERDGFMGTVVMREDGSSPRRIKSGGIFGKWIPA